MSIFYKICLSIKMYYFLVVRGFIKTNFNNFSNNYKTYGYGSITDGIYKLEIQISNYENEIDFVKGEQIEVKGFVKVAS